MPNLTLKLLITLASALSVNLAHAQYCDPELTLHHPSNEYTEHGDGTVTDNRSGLMWRKCSIGENIQDCTSEPQLLNWQEAHLAAATANTQTFAGYTNWRLPNIKELMSLVERSCEEPAINSAIFPIKLKDYASPEPYRTSFWTSTPNYIDSSENMNAEAATLEFSSEVMPRTVEKIKKMQARLVRDTN